MLTGKKILLGVTASIAAYKSLLLVRQLVKAGAEVKVLMTPSAADFVTPLSLATLSKNPVLIDLFDESSWANHVMLGRWADVMIIAPLSCNTLAKMSNGYCDNLLMAVYLSATCPVMVAPAMDEDMWLHPSTKLNIDKIVAFGNTVIPVENGELASGLSGEGRMAEPETIIESVISLLNKSKELTAVRAMVTAGPTYEQLDPVRFIGNNSSGKMGVAIADELASRGAEVTLILGPSEVQPAYPYQVINVRSAKEMYDACMEQGGLQDIMVLAAAVADYKSEQVSSEKIKKKDDKLSLNLVRTDDILKKLGELKKGGQVIVGFALETNTEKENALGKLKSKNADIIILNSLRDKQSGFGFDTNKITIFDRKGNEEEFENKPKTEVAKDIVNKIIAFRNA